ncbi:MAG: 2-amino-4-hydroxy-6-hydroxymethyldihydropteridine diphosphokinase [Deltaproteobacteria bacterium]|nr:2-amino-4-hydroxy-6-hydroxymethyldihydropteridine diphosphokinase [Deltaproteobacteria bacterium]
MNVIAFIAIGSNLEDRLTNCQKAVQQLATPEIQIEKISPWYRSPALTLDGKPQPDYCNGVVQISTSLSAEELFVALKQIETKMERPEKHAKWEPRVIDLDLLLFDHMIVSTSVDLPHPTPPLTCPSGRRAKGRGMCTLTIPHPEMTKRLFVLQPLTDIAPEVVHPIEKKSIADLLKLHKCRHPQERIELWGNT